MNCKLNIFKYKHIYLYVYLIQIKIMKISPEFQQLQQYLKWVSDVSNIALKNENLPKSNKIP